MNNHNSIHCLIEIGQLFNCEQSWRAQFDDSDCDTLTVYHENKRYCFIKIKSEKEVAVTYVADGDTDFLYRNEKYVVGKIMYETKNPQASEWYNWE